jgi:hypothetical protein
MHHQTALAYFWPVPNAVSVNGLGEVTGMIPFCEAGLMNGQTSLCDAL